jgi:S-DNA-T family DNA segregation ATPase FtsK/SpoIIIE
MGEITTIARVGRSLGFHIILISQNIEGAITDDIRVNSNARLCLKVATRQASKEMIGTELAASAYMPGNGRAYLLVGTGSKFEYFQSAYSGAGEEESIPVEITLVSKTGPYVSFYHSDKDNLEIRKRREEQKKAGTARSQLEAICESICAINSAYESELKTPHEVFSKPLSSCIAWNREKDSVIDLSKRKLVSK